MINRFHKTKLTGISVLAFLLVAVMLVGMIPSVPLEVHAATVRTSSKAFTGDFTLELWDSQDSSKHETHKMTHDGNQWNTLKSSVLPANFLAYTGTTGSVTARSATDYTVTPVEDQSTAEKYNAADVMIATGTVSKDESLNLNFEHYFTQIRLTIYRESEFSSEEPIKNIYVRTGNENVPEVKPYATRTDWFYSAYIPAGTYSSGSVFARIEIGEYTGENALVVTLPQDITLEAGKINEFNLTVGKKLLEITKSDNDSLGSGWTDEINCDGNEIIGTPDAGKTTAVNGDKILTSMSFHDGSKVGAVLERKNGIWALNDRTFYEWSPISKESVYAPDCEIKVDGSIGYKDGKLPGMNEYIKVNNQHINGSSYRVNFDNVTRDYSRLRLVGAAGKTYTVNVTDFTPAGLTESGTYSYTLTADEKGNAYLYGTFAKGGTVSVTGATSTMTYAFSEATENGKSYSWKPIEYITFSSERPQNFTWTVCGLPYEGRDMEYSLNGGEWTRYDNPIFIKFGGEYGDLRWRSKNGFGTAKDTALGLNYLYICLLKLTEVDYSDVPTKCYGDLRTLADYENYSNVSWDSVRFDHLFDYAINLTEKPTIPNTP